MYAGIKLSDLYEGNIESNLQLDFRVLIEKFGPKRNSQNGSTFFAGIKALSTEVQEMKVV
ncbi:hypothetical protein [Pigmentibacter ruber]|uniref:hypothetical protein n=1 Tax=Pigmentibacter ruber TaxID=2683196 RepID=UPI00131C1781|nr:hypothetical protein [Pigmentibacter ruber]